MQHSKFLTLVLSLLLLSESTPTRVSAAAGDLGALCVKLGKSSVSSKECYGVFSQDPRSSTANFTELATIAVDIVTNNAAKLQSLIDSSLKNERNLTLKVVLDACSNDYYGVMYILKKAKASMLLKDYGPVLAALSSECYAAVQQCINEIHNKGAVIPLVKDGSNSLVRTLAIAQLTLGLPMYPAQYPLDNNEKESGLPSMQFFFKFFTFIRCFRSCFRLRFRSCVAVTPSHASWHNALSKYH